MLDISSLLTNILCFVITGLLTLLSTRLHDLRKRQEETDKRRKENNALIKGALQAISRQQLITEHDRLTAQGCASYQAKSTWTNLYEYYEKLGTNGVMERYHKDIINLPTKEN